MTENTPSDAMVEAMTDEAKALVERLRALHVWPQAVADGYADLLTRRQIEKLYEVGHVSHEAADLIETQAHEIERLRAVLRGIVDNCGQCGGYGIYPEEETVTGKVLWWDCSSPLCTAARAALAGDSHD